MAPPNDGNEPIPFKNMIELERISANVFRSKALPFSPGGFGRAYGGHVYSQAAWAAAQTVKSEFIIHTVTGFFITAGLTTVPFVYNVKTIRDGRSYCTRTVNVTQAESEDICFTCTCSFKKPEESYLDAQDKIDIHDKFKVALRGKRLADMANAPAMDVPWYVQKMKETGYNDPEPGLDTRQADMSLYNKGLSSFERRQLHFYRVLGELPPDPNLHACAHLYASDRNSLFVVGNHFDVAEGFTGGFRAVLGSLSHTVIFHVSATDLMMVDKESGERIWFCKEDWTTRAVDGRGVYNGRLVGPGGAHMATICQIVVVQGNLITALNGCAVHVGILSA